MWLLAAFIAVPLIEIALFIQVGGAIGLWPTLLIVVVTAILGTSLVRSQGALALSQVRRSFNELRDPAEPLANGAMILFAGALLLTPGFFTDACGFALLVPGVRKLLFEEMKKRVRVQAFSTRDTAGPARPREQHTRHAQGDVIDADYAEVEIRTPDPDRRPSGWTSSGSDGRSGRQ